MLPIARFSLNRIACPNLGLADFFTLAAECGFSKVELRNDIPGGRPIDGFTESSVRALAEANGVQVIAINALQKFNLTAARSRSMEELRRLLELARAVRCPAIVLCPNNDAADRRGVDERVAETVEALKILGPLFMDQKTIGYVEPLGFPESSLDSVLVAMNAIRSSGFACYRVLFDTFHHFIGPDTEQDIGTLCETALTGLVHVSGVDADIPKEEYRDEHRVFPGPADHTSVRRQIRRLVELGYPGDFSFEPFAPSVQGMDNDAMVEAVRRSIDYLRA